MEGASCYTWLEDYQISEYLSDKVFRGAVMQ